MQSGCYLGILFKTFWMLNFLNNTLLWKLFLGVGEGFSEMFLKTEENLPLLLDFLEEFDFKIRWGLVELMEHPLLKLQVHHGSSPAPSHWKNLGYTRGTGLGQPKNFQKDWPLLEKWKTDSITSSSKCYVSFVKTVLILKGKGNIMIALCFWQTVEKTVDPHNPISVSS